MLQNTSKTLGFQKIMVYKTPPGGGGEVNHIWLMAYIGNDCSAVLCGMLWFIVVGSYWAFDVKDSGCTGRYCCSLELVVICPC